MRRHSSAALPDCIGGDEAGCRSPSECVIKASNTAEADIVKICRSCFNARRSRGKALSRQCRAVSSDSRQGLQSGDAFGTGKPDSFLSRRVGKIKSFTRNNFCRKSANNMLNIK